MYPSQRADRHFQLFLSRIHLTSYELSRNNEQGAPRIH